MARNYTDDANLSGDYARDPRRSGYGDNYARERPSFRGRGPKNYRRSDERIADDIHRILTDDEDLDATHVDVAVSDGVVTLTGAVSSRRSKRLAEDLVLQCSGVHDVFNQLKVLDTPGQPIGKASE